jgi:hypothetical protein
MTARRAYPFEQTVAGETTYGIVFASAAERDEALQVLLGNGSVVAAPDERVSEQPRQCGRPSFDTLLAGVVAELGARLDYGRGIAACTSQVLQHLAQRCEDAELLPSRRTVEIYLAAARARGKVRGKSHGNSRGGIRRKGGSHARS